MTRQILRIDASMRRDGSTTRMLSDEVIAARVNTAGRSLNFSVRSTNTPINRA